MSVSVCVHMCLLVCVSVYVCVYRSAFECVHVCACVSEWVRVHVLVCVCVRVRVCLRVSVCACVWLHAFGDPQPHCALQFGTGLVTTDRNPDCGHTKCQLPHHSQGCLQV